MTQLKTIYKLIKPISYSIEKCGICGSMNTMVTDHRYRCYDCGYDDPYTWDNP